jgi:ATP-dependent DNA helicase PIF1
MSSTSASPLTISQARAYTAVAEGKNIFLTGAGGTGKSYLISHIKASLSVSKKIAITALTGCAAILLGSGAKTLHSWAGIGLGKEDVETLLKKIRLQRKAKKNWTSTDLLVIDEVSMMSAELFEKLDTIARRMRGRDVPFGGMQVILAGDFFQLPPIQSTSFLFESAIWDRVVDECVELVEIKRQSDPIFQGILNAARRGQMKREHIDVLRTRIGLDWKDEAIKPTLLFPRRVDVDRINADNLRALTGPTHTYTADTVEVRGETISKVPSMDNDPVVDAYDKNAPYRKDLVLAEGVQVMLVYNLDIDAGLVNGSRGVVIGFSPDGQPIVMFKGVTRVVGRANWPIDEENKLYRRQVPLILAYAQTIHKCQGATLDSAAIDLGSNMFEYGQGYVALSRVKSLDSLYILNFDPNALKVNKKVQAFYMGMLEAMAPA